VGGPAEARRRAEVARLVNELLGSDRVAVHAALRRLAASLAADELLRDRHRLTPREADVARLLALGKSNAEIAAALGISEHTGRRHTEQVLAKLGVRSRAAVAAAIGLAGAGWGSAA
jgi:DNA-binding NarL/FixJ family response regulator